MERIMGNSLHVLGVVHHDLITWSFMRSFLVEFTKYLLVVHALMSVLDDHHEKENSSITSIDHIHDAFVGLLS